MDKKNIVISGYYGFDNSGDDAILKAIVDELKNADKNLDITVLSKDPSLTRKIYGVKSMDRFSFKEVRNALKYSDLLISGGGSLLQDITSARSLLYYLAIMAYGKILGKKVMVYANGVGPINGKINRFLTKLILDRVDLITLRDKDSLDYIRDLKVKNKNVYLSADPVYTLESSDQNIIMNIFEKEGLDFNKKYIGISLRDWKHSENLEENIILGVKHILENYSQDILFIPMHYPEDLAISNRIKEKFESDRVNVLEGKYQVEEIMGIIENMDILIAMRLHSLIYAAVNHIPMLGISYDPKVDGILKTLNIENIVDVHNFTSEEFIKAIDKIVKDSDRVRERLKMREPYLKRRALENVKMALELLEK